MALKISLVVPTYNPGKIWLEWLNAVAIQTIPADTKLIIDSSSSDGSVEQSSQYGFKVIVIEQNEFDHGGTRQLALDYIDDSDVVVYLTQDAILQNKDSLKNLVEVFNDESVAIVYGRQLPNKNATPIEAHARLYNYTEESHIYSYEDKDKVGLKAAFNSNSFSAYRVSALKKINGFKSNIIFGEDMLAAAEALKKGYKVAYCHTACVFHSHAYSLKQEFQRYFDMGVMHNTQTWLLADFGKPTGEGFRFIKSEMGYLMRHSPWRLPEAFIRTLMKFIGYRAGFVHTLFPFSLKRMLGMNKKYWTK